ncbi:aldo/keto reductase [Pseudoduganella umbonata]|uniref:Aldo/keto reductase n=1 Tax=Pseudoduganella umbonata TaxID=864828 RepID=A0A4P8HM52_9BURK|nr:aldo/keto reductase [Pseudoduganella umbonata]MBB3222678.1 aryl-alcohol dehydrogenase-like predicted oxidoreductase [Pseudoduganella umbonata]QCP10819.1 aldo/keto reductase [Pseudoduganella umbonata]
MKYRTIANMRVSALGLGCMGMSEFYGATDEAQSLRTLEAAYDAGVTLFDTAESYGNGDNERLLGRFLAGRRADVRVATKFGIVREAGRYERRIDNSPAYIRQAVEGSLSRLGTDTIDLYYVHRIDPGAALEDTIGTLAGLVDAGKVRAIGLCEVTPATLRRAAAVHPIAAVQSEYSLWTRDPEDGMLAACAELGTAFCAYSPLGRGFLTGKFDSATPLAPDDFRSFNPRFTGDNLQANLKIADTVRRLAADKGCTPAQLALAWLLAQGDHVIPIPGTKREAYLRENLGAVDVVLAPAEVAAIGAALPRGIAAGQRYSDEGMKGLNA